MCQLSTPTGGNGVVTMEFGPVLSYLPCPFNRKNCGSVWSPNPALRSLSPALFRANSSEIGWNHNGIQRSQSAQSLSSLNFICWLALLTIFVFNCCRKPEERRKCVYVVTSPPPGYRVWVNWTSRANSVQGVLGGFGCCVHGELLAVWFVESVSWHCLEQSRACQWRPKGREFASRVGEHFSLWITLS